MGMALYIIDYYVIWVRRFNYHIWSWDILKSKFKSWDELGVAEEPHFMGPVNCVKMPKTY